MVQSSNGCKSCLVLPSNDRPPFAAAAWICLSLRTPPSDSIVLFCRHNNASCTRRKTYQPSIHLCAHLEYHIITDLCSYTTNHKPLSTNNFFASLGSKPSWGITTTINLSSTFFSALESSTACFSLAASPCMISVCRTR